MKNRFLLVTLLLVPALGCKGEEPPPPAEQKPAETRRSNIERIQMTVPYGKQAACTDVFDPAVFSQAIGDEIREMEDRGSSNKEASLSCAFHRAGEPPKDDAQLRKYEQEGLKLGVLPGDEYCMVTAYCSLAADAESFKKQCEQRGDSMNVSAVGQPACVHITQRGVENAYSYKVIDPETRCVLEVLGGPSVTDETLVQNCTRAALEDITPGELKNFR